VAAHPKKSKRLQLATWVKDRLWSEAGGHCQNLECRVDLLDFVKRKHIGELAHIIPASDDGPRAEDGRALTDSERALPENILLLCPTCHVVIDKAPDEYPPTASSANWEISRGLKKISKMPLTASRSPELRRLEMTPRPARWGASGAMSGVGRSLQFGGEVRRQLSG
jgi:hypothetical protein